MRKRFLAGLLVLSIALISYFFPGLWPVTLTPIMMVAIWFGVLMNERSTSKKKVEQHKTHKY